MSRTIRRTKAKKYRSRFEKEYTYYIPEEWDNRSIGNRGIRWVKDFPLLPLEGKEFEKAYWKYHSDSGCKDFSFENAFEYPMREDERAKRSRYKREISRWLKDEDYEIQFQKSKQIWDYC